MKFENTVVICGDENIKVCEKNLYAGPMTIKEIERFELPLEAAGKNYLLVQTDTTTEAMALPMLTINRKHPEYRTKSVRGYCLFYKERP